MERKGASKGFTEKKKKNKGRRRIADTDCQRVKTSLLDSDRCDRCLEYFAIKLYGRTRSKWEEGRVNKVVFEISFMKVVAKQDQRGLRESKKKCNERSDRYENFLPFKQLSGYIGSFYFIIFFFP